MTSSIDTSDVERFDELLREETFWRSSVGEGAYSAMLDLARSDAQREVLSHPKIEPVTLARLFNADAVPHLAASTLSRTFSSSIWESFLHRNPFRIIIPELPQSSGSSAPYKDNIDSELRQFRRKYKRLLTPLRIPLGMEVIVKPPPSSRHHVNHDLDNIARDYLIPKVSAILQPPSDMLWTMEDLSQSALASKIKERIARLPRSAKVGLVRYDMWRMPRDVNVESPGFVSVGLVADDFGYDNTLSRIDSYLTRWQSTPGY